MANAADERRALRCPVRIKRPLKLRVLFAARTPHERTITERTRLAAHITRRNPGLFIDTRQLIPLLLVRFFESIPFPFRNYSLRDAGFPRLSARDRHRLVLTQALILYIHRKVIDQILDEQVRRVLGPDVDLVDRLVDVLGLLLFDAVFGLLLDLGGGSSVTVTLLFLCRRPTPPFLGIEISL